jgi:hypothetical protein
VGFDAPVTYRRDQLGNVHLSGYPERCGTPSPDPDRIFTLPKGYRPEGGALYPTFAAFSNSPVKLDIESNGAVFALNSAPDEIVQLIGISFRCAPSGKNGCP